MLDFNFTKFIYLLHLNAHKNIQINQFKSYSLEIKFWVLHVRDDNLICCDVKNTNKHFWRCCLGWQFYLFG